jgi:hypothetical protein
MCRFLNFFAFLRCSSFYFDIWLRCSENGRLKRGLLLIEAVFEHAYAEPILYAPPLGNF